jgi:hypothetical protein
VQSAAPSGSYRISTARSWPGDSKGSIVDVRRGENWRGQFVFAHSGSVSGSMPRGVNATLAALVVGRGERVRTNMRSRSRSVEIARPTIIARSHVAPHHTNVVSSNLLGQIPEHTVDCFLVATISGRTRTCAGNGHGAGTALSTTSTV